MRSKTWSVAALAAGAALVLAGCADGGGGDSDDQTLTVLIGSSGEAETSAMEAAAAAYGEEAGVEVDVVVAANLTEELAQGFSGDSPPDLFYMSWDQFQTYAGNGYLESYAGDLPNAGDFFPAFVDEYTFDGEFVCAPKDFSTLGLIVNIQKWQEAGLTDADIPTDWEGLREVATALTTGDTVGLSFGQEYARVGVFMNQAGGALVEDGEVVVDSPENLEALEYLQSLYGDGVLRFPGEIDAGWGGEALGSGRAAMVIEGPWIKGIATDYPDTEYAVYELPAGPAGQSTFSFTNCWGIPADSPTADAAQGLVEYLTSEDQQIAFADAFGVIPSIESAAQAYGDANPELGAFVAGADYAEAPVAFDGAAAVLSEFNARLADFGNADFAAILAEFQAQLEAAYAQANG